VLSLTLIAWIAGCGRWQDTAAPAPAEPWKQDPVGGTPPSPEDEPTNKARQSTEIGDDRDEPRRNETRPAKPTDSSQAEASELAGEGRYNTGDCDDWPSCELPLVVEIEILEVPEEIARRAEPIPDAEE
jgi:hypothetical protein